MRKTKELKTTERRKLKNTIYEKTGYYIRSNCLLSQAFTRSSYTVDHGGENNEILEFLGDRVLNLYTAKIIADKLGGLNSDAEYTFKINEGKLSTLCHELLSNESLAKIIDTWDVCHYLVAGKSDFDSQVDLQTKTKADLLEAIIGAVAVASKWNKDVLEEAIRRILPIREKVADINKSLQQQKVITLENAVNTLKELAEHGFCTPPQYDYGTPEHLGYDQDGNPIWTCRCIVTNKKAEIIRQVWASSKKNAKKAAAYLTLCELFDSHNQYGPRGKYLNWTYTDGRLTPKNAM